MATEIAQAYVQIMPSAKGIGDSLKKTLGGGEASAAGDAAGANIGKALVGTLTKVVAAAGIGKIVGDALGEAGRMQQGYFGGLDTIYGEAANKAREYADAAATAGVSMNDYADQAVSFGAALKQSYGGDMTAAIDAANMAILDMADNSAKMGTDLETVQRAYQGFARGNYQMLDNLKLGYGQTKGEMERLLADASRIKTETTGEVTNFSIDNLGDVYEAIHVIQEDLGLTGVAADEAAGTFTGSTQSMKAAWSNLLAQVTTGQDFSQSLDVFAKSAANVANNTIPLIGNIVSKLPSALIGVLKNIDFSTITSGIIQQFQRLTGQIYGTLARTDWAAAAKTIADGLVNGLQNVMSGLDTLTTVASNMMQKLGEGLRTAIPELLNNVMPIIMEFTGNLRENAGALVDAGLDMIINIGNGLIESLPVLIQTVPTIITNLIGIIKDNAPKLIMAGLELIINLGRGLIENIPVIIENIGQIIHAIWDIITVTDWLSLGGMVVQTIATGIGSLLSLIATKAAELVKKIWDKIQSTDWLELGKKIIRGIRDGIKSLVDLAVTAISNLVRDIKQKVTETDWLGLGKSILDGIISGITAFGDTLITSILSLCEGAFDAVKRFFHIGSPSKLMRDEIGRWIPAGIAEGITKNADVVDDAMNSLIDSVSHDYGVDVRVSKAHDNRLDLIIALLSEFLPECADNKAVVDGDSLMKSINRTLGMAI